MKNPSEQLPVDHIDEIAESYVKLVLSVGEHDSDYVDAYFGPPQWREHVKANPVPLDTIRVHAHGLLGNLNVIGVPSREEIEKLRHHYLAQQLRSLSARVEMLKGKSFSFDEEALALYDAHPPHHPETFFQDVLGKLDGLVPGSGTLAHRYDRYRSSFVVPVGKLDAVFQAAIQECRERTGRNILLPPGERFTLDYVTNKPWSGYNWYKGNSISLIQINTDLPIYIDRAIDLAAHEGYPGHHVYNSLLEAHLARKRGWIEFTIYALFSPQSLIAEGTANFGIEVAFPGNERVEFERSVLFPLAGLDGSAAEQYYAIHNLTGALNYAHNEAARGYLDGTMTRDQAEQWLVTYALMSPERAKQRVRFIDAYRSYVINYNLGQDLVRKHIEMRGGTADNPAKRWEEFKVLISSPRLPSGL
ncbi:MAG: hypothetical protein NTZ35_07065 [Ignavibacteriales bacterium]|nr:hypothetical protein [Ignavibacteriales bacterium]